MLAKAKILSLIYPELESLKGYAGFRIVRQQKENNGRGRNTRPLSGKRLIISDY